MPISSVFKISASLSEILHSHYAFTGHFYQLVVQFHAEIYFAHKYQITLSTSLGQVSIAHLTDFFIICFTLFFLPKMIMVAQNSQARK
jgi:hypothetical protein